MGRALVYFSTLQGGLGSAPLPGEVGIPSGRQTASRLVGGGHPLSPRHCCDAEPQLGDLGAVPTSEGRAELLASPPGFPGACSCSSGAARAFCRSSLAGAAG